MKQKLRISRVSQALLLWLTFSPLAASAESLTDIVKNPLKEVAVAAGLMKSGDTTKRSPLDLFGVYLSLMLGFVGVVFIVQVVHGGYLWMTAGGNEEKVKKAISKISNGAAGAAVIFLAYIVTALVLNLIGQYAGVPTGFEETP